jgi:hypothetical protein
LHSPKHDLQRISTDDGMIIDFNPECENADFSIRTNFDPFSNTIDSSRMQNPKHDLQRISIDDGRISDFNPEHENTDSSIRINFDPFSKIIDSSDSHF